MSIETLARTAIAYNNAVTPTAVTSIVTTNIPAFVTGFPAANWEIESPWTMAKTSGVTSDPVIEFVFGSAKANKCIGLINHNITSTYPVAFAVEYYTGSAWTTVATRTSDVRDGDIFMSWTNDVSSTRWRVAMTFGGSAHDFFLGSIFYGSRIVLERNPDVTQVRETQLLVEETAGGSKNVIFGADSRPATMDLSWERTTFNDLDFWKHLPKYALVGVCPPEQIDAGSSAVKGQESFWGYVANRTMQPRGPGGMSTTQPARYGLVVNLEGAV